MRKLFAFLTLSLTGTWAYGANGVAAPLTVSSGTFQGVSMYGNADGANRQAIVIGDFTSSDTLRVDQITGIPVRLSTSSLTTSGAVLVVTSQTIPVSGAFFQATQPVSFGATNIATVTPGTGTYAVSGTFFQATQPVSFGATNIATVTPGTGTFVVNGSGVTQPVSVAIPYTVILTTSGANASTTTVVISGTPNVSASQSGTWNTNATVINTATTTFNGIGQPVTSTYTVITTTYPINIAGSFSATSASTGTINSSVPGVATLVGAQGLGGNLSSFRVDSSSYLYVNVAAGGAAGGTSSNFGSSFPTPGTAVGFTNGTNMQAGRVDVSSSIYVTFGATQIATVTPGTGTFSSSLGATSIVTVTPGTGTWSTSASQSGTWTVQPGNTQNTTAWVVTSSGSQVQGMVASGGANANNPVKIGVVASSNVLTGVNDTQITNLYGTRMGNMLATLNCPRENIVKATATLTTNTNEIVFLSSGAASTYNDLLEVVAANTSGTASRLDFRSAGGPTSQTIDFAFYIPAGDTRGFTLPHPWPQTNAAANWTIQGSASVTDIRVYGTFCKQK